MKLESKTRVHGSVAEVEKSLSDPKYLDFLLKHHGVLLEAQAIDVKDDGDVVRRKIRYRPKPVIRSVGPKEIPPEWFAFIETSTYDKKRRELRFENVPTSQSIAHMLVNTGTLRLVDVGGGMTERQMTGELHIKVPFLLKPLAVIAERLIAHEGVKLLEGEAPVLNRYISEVVRAAA